MAFSPRASRARILLGVTLSAVVASALAACSGSTNPELTATPSVTANGSHYAYEAGSVSRSKWPAVCSLVPEDSVAAAVGTDVATSTFHARCYYIPANDAFPTLTVTILGLGTGQRSAYNRVRAANASRKPASVDGVGKAAVTYPLAGSPTVNLDLLADQGLFELSLRSPVGNKASPAEAQDVLVSVGRILAQEFAG